MWKQATVATSTEVRPCGVKLKTVT